MTPGDDDMTQESADDECTCIEVHGEDPNCKLHGFATDWALEVYTPEDWQQTAIEFQEEVARLRAKTDTRPAPVSTDGLEIALEALDAGATWFEEYAEHHARLADAAGYHVGKERNEKADRNRQRANKLRSAIEALRRPTAPEPGKGVVERMARATCAFDGSDPDEIMVDGKPRWMDRVPCMELVLAALTPTELSDVTDRMASNIGAAWKSKEPREGVGLLRECRAWISTAGHDEDCELHPDFGEQNLENSNEEALQAAHDAGGDERDVRFRTHPQDAVCTCERGKFLARIDTALASEGGSDD